MVSSTSKEAKVFGVLIGLVRILKLHRLMFEEESESATVLDGECDMVLIGCDMVFGNLDVRFRLQVCAEVVLMGSKSLREVKRFLL